MLRDCFWPASWQRVICWPPPFTTPTVVGGMGDPAVSSTAFPVARRMGSKRRLLGTCDAEQMTSGFFRYMLLTLSPHADTMIWHLPRVLNGV